MKLSYLSVSPIVPYMAGYIDGENRYNVVVKYDGKHGDITLKLGSEFAARMLALVAEELVAGSKEIAQRLTSETIDASRAALTHQKPGDTATEADFT